MRLTRDAAGWAVEGAWYRLSGTVDGAVARLEDDAGRMWAELRLLASVDTRAGEDETFAISGPEFAASADETAPPLFDGAPAPAGGNAVGSMIAAETGLVWTLRGSRWSAKRLVLRADDATLSIHVEVEGSGELTDVTLLAGRVVGPRASGVVMSGAWFRSIVPAAPGDPARIVQPASETAMNGVVSGAEPGRGRWFFSPAPFVVAASRSVATSPVEIPTGPWLAFGLDAVAGEARFTEFGYLGRDTRFGFRIDYDGHTTVDGTWQSPPLVITSAGDPFGAMADQATRLAARSSGKPAADARRGRTPAPSWWREPIFCGWGAQSALVVAAGRTMAAAASASTQANYDAFLGHLEDRGVVPGTIVIDDKWQATYGENEVDHEKWPDLRGWIEDRRRRGQRVLLWYKAWDPEGLPAELCVRTTAGTPIGLDPSHPDAERAIRRAVATMLGPDELGADGLKIDFTARTPSGRATVHHGPAWGTELLRRLLEIVADEARRLHPEPLLIGHTPNGIVAPSVDMIRLNDALRLDDPEPAADIVPSMRFRAAVVRAACPDHLIDTDDWCAPSLAAWRSYTAMKTELGVPALYYATSIDRTGELLEESDYALLRRTWAAYRRSEGLPPRGRD